MWESGLPAMQAPRCKRYTAVMLSQASQLPHKPAPTFSAVYGLTSPSRLGLRWAAAHACS
ncbi:hypothetical protein DXU77_18575 [Pseudomonas lactis]|nr:hypothetical protein [Pseudomonas lactis]